MRTTLGVIFGLSLLGGLTAMVNAQDAGLNRRETGLLDPLTSPGLGSQDPIAPVLSGGGSRAAKPGEEDPGAYGEQAVLLRIPDWKPWSVGISSGYEYQTNAALGPATSIEDVLFRVSGSGRGTFQLTDSLYLGTGLQWQSFRYDELDLLDFDRVDVDAGLLWVIPQAVPVLKGSVLSVKGTHYRLSEAGDIDTELFSNTGAGAALLRSINLSRNHDLLLSASADISVDATEISAQRNEYALVTGLQSRWTPRWESTVVGRATYYDYDTHQDWNLTAALSLDYLITDELRIGVSTNFSYNDSNVNLFDYENFGVGGNLRFALQF